MLSIITSLKVPKILENLMTLNSAHYIKALINKINAVKLSIWLHSIEQEEISCLSVHKQTNYSKNIKKMQSLSSATWAKKEVVKVSGMIKY